MLVVKYVEVKLEAIPAHMDQGGTATKDQEGKVEKSTVVLNYVNHKKNAKLCITT